VSGFSEQLRAAAAPLWEAQYRHPFVRGIANGSLDPERFRCFIRQDWLFLGDYARLLALGAARAPDLATMRRFVELARSVVEDEMSLHRQEAAAWGITAAELDATAIAPTTRAYGDFLVRTASAGDFAELAAALLPCMWGYAELGSRLAQEPRPADERYSRWIEAYASQEFAALAAWCRELVDALAAEAGPATRRAMTDAFVTCSRYELAFWQMAWDLEASSWSTCTTPP
jgi:thiaminase/transcriptional activator TenA